MVHHILTFVLSGIKMSSDLIFFSTNIQFSLKQYQFLKLTLFPVYLYRDQIYKKFGIQLAFIATRSGLMRYSDHSALFRDPNYRPKLDPDIIPEP